jgi:hypothetical protein
MVVDGERKERCALRVSTTLRGSRSMRPDHQLCSNHWEPNAGAVRTMIAAYVKYMQQGQEGSQNGIKRAGEATRPDMHPGQYTTGSLTHALTSLHRPVSNYSLILSPKHGIPVNKHQSSLEHAVVESNRGEMSYLALSNRQTRKHESKTTEGFVATPQIGASNQSARESAPPRRIKSFITRYGNDGLPCSKGQCCQDSTMYN